MATYSASELVKGKMIAGVLYPYASIVEANTAVLLARRDRFHERYITIDGVVKIYWYRDGVADDQLIPKNPGDKPFTEVFSVSNVTELDLREAELMYMTLAQDTELQFINEDDVHLAQLEIFQDATGGNEVTFDSNIELLPGYEIALDANAQTIINFYRDSSGLWKAVTSILDTSGLIQRFGVSGEDDIAGEARDMDMNGNTFTLAGGDYLNLGANDGVDITSPSYVSSIAPTATLSGSTVVEIVGAGEFYVNIPSKGTAGHVLTSIDANGTAEWLPAGGSTPITIENTSSLFSTGLIGSGSGSSGNYSLFLGADAGSGATNAHYSNFLGVESGLNGTDATYSNFLGYKSGYTATSATYSNFFGSNAGYGATTANNSNFLGFQSGYNATGASLSNFLGFRSGHSASGATNSNFLGNEAGYQATSASNSNFIGNYSGHAATSATYSNFFGYYAGELATGASYSNFIGITAGHAASAASYSNFIGYNAGKTFTSNNLGSNNIIIGTNISLPDAATNSINIGAVLFALGTFSTISIDPSIAAVADSKVGLGIVIPTAQLDVAASTTNRASARLRVGTAPSSPNDGDIWLESNSITGLKIRLNGVTYTVTLT